MEDMIGRILVAFFAVVGLTELCRFVLFWLTRPGWEEKITVLVCVSGNDSRVEYRLRGALERLRWLRHTGHRELICVDCGMDSETRAICEAFALANPSVRLCMAADLPETLGGEFANT
ncbi:hypothetical protein [Faecalispora anaeroviscerum]|uniref:hypothetical protein n=1 Tax=Faecalispora anaeroviscerum TaxID=2991836 RepID=UPI0024BA5A31|nr:hypothetical protein [Faecalispora anaeroviscerum]